MGHTRKLPQIAMRIAGGQPNRHGGHERAPPGCRGANLSLTFLKAPGDWQLAFGYGQSNHRISRMPDPTVLAKASPAPKRSGQSNTVFVHCMSPFSFDICFQAIVYSSNDI